MKPGLLAKAGRCLVLRALSHVWSLVMGHWSFCGCLILLASIGGMVGNAQTFTGRNVGAPAQSGSATTNPNGTITLTGGGDDIWNNSDNFYYYSASITGLWWDAVVRVMSFDGPDYWSKVGLMVRRPTPRSGPPQGSDPHISNILTRTNGENGIELQDRGTRAGASGDAAAPGVTPMYPQWLRVQRSNNVFILYYGANGTTNWVQYASVDTASTANGFDGVAWENPILVGVAVTAHNNTPPNVATAVITNLAVSVHPTKLPTLAGVQTQIQNVIGYNGIEATFAFVATNNASPNFYGMQYRWYKNSQLVSTDAPGTQYTFLATAADSNAQIYCVANVQAPYSSLTVTSAIATLTVLPWTTSPWIWWEAESPSASNFPASTWLSPSSQSEHDALSGGDILTAVNIKATGPYWANYNVNVAAAGTYRFYTRKLWNYGPFKWRFDSGAWVLANSQLQLMDGAGYKPNFPLDWVYLGDVTLAAGAHTFGLEMNAADWPTSRTIALRTSADLTPFCFRRSRSSRAGSSSSAKNIIWPSLANGTSNRCLTFSAPPPCWICVRSMNPWRANPALSGRRAITAASTFWAMARRCGFGVSMWAIAGPTSRPCPNKPSSWPNAGSTWCATTTSYRPAMQTILTRWIPLISRALTAP